SIQCDQLHLAQCDALRIDGLEDRSFEVRFARDDARLLAAAFNGNVAPAGDRNLGPVLARQQTNFAAPIRQNIDGLLNRIEIAVAGDAVPDYPGTATAGITQGAKSLTAVMNAGLQNVLPTLAPSDQRQRREEIPRTGRRGRIEQFPGHDEIRSVGARG